MPTTFRVNGRAVSADAPPETPLLWVIREEIKLTGTKFGCGAGLCGACMVHVDGKRAFSCQTQLADVAGREVTTIEGLTEDGKLHSVQQAFIEQDDFRSGEIPVLENLLEFFTSKGRSANDGYPREFSGIQRHRYAAREALRWRT